MDLHTSEHLLAHVHALVIPAPTVGLLDADEDRAHKYLDTLIGLLFDTLADADPWRETFGMEDVTVDGDRFGEAEAFDDILAGGIVRRAIESFAPVERDPQSLDEKNRLVAWLTMRHKLISVAGWHCEPVPPLAEAAAKIASGEDVAVSREYMVTLHRIDDASYFMARDQIHGL